MDSKLFRYETKIIKKGGGLKSPNDFAVCRTLIYCQSSSDVDRHLLGLDLNEEKEMIIGLGRTYTGCVVDLVLQKMVEDSNVQLTIPELNISLELILISFESSKESFKLSDKEKLARAVQLKTIGTECFQNGSTDVAFYKFNRSLKYLICINSRDEVDETLANDMKRLRCQCFLNLAACQLKTGSFKLSVANCSQGLAIDPTNVKGLFRRSQAFVKLGEHEKAKHDLEEAISFEPKNKTLIRSLHEIKINIKRIEDEFKESMSKMFK